MEGQAQLELKLPSVASNNKTGFLKCVNSKRSKQNIGLMLLEDGHLTKRTEEKVERFNVFFTSVLDNTNRQ